MARGRVLGSWRGRCRRPAPARTARSATLHRGSGDAASHGEGRSAAPGRPLSRTAHKSGKSHNTKLRPSGPQKSIQNPIHSRQVAILALPAWPLYRQCPPQSLSPLNFPRSAGPSHGRIRCTAPWPSLAAAPAGQGMPSAGRSSLTISGSSVSHTWLAQHNVQCNSTGRTVRLAGWPRPS